MAETVKCVLCGVDAPKRSWAQRYCLPCSESLHERRVNRAPVVRSAQKSLEIERGAAISKEVTRKTLFQDEPFLADDGWVAKFKVPFSVAASKNHIWSLGRGKGHVFKRQQSRQYQEAIALAAKAATRGLTIHNNKIWIDLFVQKPNHRGDAINVIDVVCDGLKVGLGVDDRWFCIRQVDWEIAKVDPQIFISIYQRDTFDALCCSHCGRILSLEHYNKKSAAKFKVYRVCRDCRYGKSRKRKAA